jgi:hypothetical protein
VRTCIAVSMIFRCSRLLREKNAVSSLNVRIVPDSPRSHPRSDPPSDFSVSDLAILRQLRVPPEIAGISAYSALNTRIGSRRDARHAGTIHANAATASSVAATAA